MSERTFEELLAKDGRIVYTTRGASMRPMLTQSKSVVVIERPKGPLKKYDVALYKRGDKYVLHRVLAVRDGWYIIRGDNTFALERVPFKAVVGVLTQFTRKGRTVSCADPNYLRYARFWHAIYPLRLFKNRARRFVYVTLKRLGLLGPLKKLLGRR